MEFQSRFIWTDLSTYQLEEAKHFYQSTFHWNYQVDEQSASGPYLMAHVNNQYVAGLYELPEEWRDRNFPSFWMPYVHVQDINATISKAQSFESVTIELPPTSYSDGSTIALIRDPLGAGFTVYEGQMPNKPIRTGHGVPFWFELHASSIKTVIPFYEQLFNWKIDLQNSEHQALISLPDDTPIAHFYELDDDFRQGYEYWIPTFYVEGMDSYMKQVSESQGNVFEIFGEDRMLINDSQGAAFIISTGNNL